MLAQMPIEQLPDDVLAYLMASYCETDKLVDLAWSPPGKHTARLGTGDGADLQLCA